MSHSSRDGIPAGVRWKAALRRANDRCEAVICLVSKHWDASHGCRAEYRTAEDRGKPIFPVRLEPTAGRDITSEWQRCDVFGDGPKTVIEVDGGTESVEFLTAGLPRLRRDDRHFLADWPPVDYYVPTTVRKAPITSSVTMRWSSPFSRSGASKPKSCACPGSAPERCSSSLLCGDRVADMAAATADGSPGARVTSHSTRIHPLSIGTRVLGRWHAATVHFLCPREQA